jgi:flagellar biosynthetic protein FlhB
VSDDTAPSDKEHEPTQKKLDDARKKGEIARSTDLNTAAGYAGLFIAGMTVAPGMFMDLGRVLSRMIGEADVIAQDMFTGGGSAFLGATLARLLRDVGPFLLLPAAAVILSLLLQRGFVFAPDKLAPKLQRISLIGNAKNKFGRAGLFEFAKSFAKLVIYSLILSIFLTRTAGDLFLSVRLTPELSTVLLLDLSARIVGIVCIVAALVGLLDVFWQRHEHLRKNRMTRKEVMDEHKANEGDPHVKQQRRQRGYDIAMRQMLADVPGADVVIVNPTHYAVALTWSRASGAAPVCVAKGVDEVAFNIREIAAEHGVPIHSDPPTTRAVYATVDIGQEILPEQYQAVAVAIRFAETMRDKAARREGAVRLKNR